MDSPARLEAYQAYHVAYPWYARTRYENGHRVPFGTRYSLRFPGNGNRNGREILLYNGCSGVPPVHEFEWEPWDDPTPGLEPGMGRIPGTEIIELNTIISTIYPYPAGGSWYGQPAYFWGWVGSWHVYATEVVSNVASIVPFVLGAMWVLLLSAGYTVGAVAGGRKERRDE